MKHERSKTCAVTVSLSSMNITELFSRYLQSVRAICARHYSTLAMNQYNKNNKTKTTNVNIGVWRKARKWLARK